MDVREKLIEIFRKPIFPHENEMEEKEEWRIVKIAYTIVCASMFPLLEKLARISKINMIGKRLLVVRIANTGRTKFPGVPTM